MIEKPRIRPLEAFPVEHNGERMIYLRDPSGAAADPIVVGIGAYYLITLLDGTRTRPDLQAEFTRQFGQSVAPEQLENLIEALDRGCFLDSPAYERRLRAMHEEFAAAPARPAAHAGLCYRDDPAQLRAELSDYFIRADARPASNGALRGLIAPHIDPRRGGLAYARAYAELAAARERPELVIILGTSHYGAGPELFTATAKDYATPLGAVRTDREFVAHLKERYRAGELFADELLHRNEHSIEFQALFLAHTLGVEDYAIVPILVSSFHPMVVRGQRPIEDRRVGEFVEVLGAMLAAERRRVLIVAGVDFGHIGRKFGDDFGVDQARATELREADRRLIGHIERADAAGFFGEIAGERDRYRICGLAPIYTQLELLAGRRARLLDYDIALEPPTQSAVSFASLAID
jgi:AmmeMemoRadiSam system protein B